MTIKMIIFNKSFYDLMAMSTISGNIFKGSKMSLIEIWSTILLVEGKMVGSSPIAL